MGIKRRAYFSPISEGLGPKGISKDFAKADSFGSRPRGFLLNRG